jgi:hypothetical protein
MIPKSGLFGAIPATPRNAAPDRTVPVPASHQPPGNAFSVMVSQAIAKKPDQPTHSQPPPAPSSSPPRKFDAAKPSDVALRAHQAVAVPASHQPPGNALFVMVSQAIAKKSDQPTALQPPVAPTSSPSGNSDTTKISNGALEEHRTSNDDVPKAKAKREQTPSVIIPIKNSIDASVLSTIMALLAPPEAPPVNRQKVVPTQGNDFRVAPEQGKKEGAKINDSTSQPHMQKLPAPPAPLSRVVPVKEPVNAVPKPVVPAAIRASVDPGKTFPPTSVPTANNSPPSNPVKLPASMPQPTVFKDVPLEVQVAVESVVPIDGTRAALNHQRMKFVAEKNETAGRVVQKMLDAPAAVDSSSDLIGKVTAKSQPSLSGHNNSTFTPDLQALVSPNSTINDLSEGKLGEKTQSDDKIAAQVERVAHLVTQEVLMVRQSGSNSLAVSLKVDSHTELFLQLTNHDGQIHASVRCERGNVEGLGSHWGELQESLARQNVQLMPLEHRVSARGNATVNPPSETSTSRAFDQSTQNRRQQFRDPEDEPLAANVAGVTLPSRKTKINNRSRQGWETWA